MEMIRPLPYPWSFPSAIRYRETCRGYLQYLTEPLIAELVTFGLMLVNEAAIRWKHLDQYVLVKIEETVYNRTNKPRLEKLDPPAYRRERTTQSGISGESNGTEISLRRPSLI